MGRKPCESCGEYLDADEMFEAGSDDDCGEIFTLYICQSCASEAAMDWPDIPGEHANERA